MFGRSCLGVRAWAVVFGRSCLITIMTVFVYVTLLSKVNKIHHTAEL